MAQGSRRSQPSLGRHALVAFHDVVPFVEVTELVHQRLVSREVEALRISQSITAELTDSLLSGSGLSGLLQRTATLAGCGAALVTVDGRVVASSEDHPSDTVVPAAGATSRPVEVFGIEWGRLLLDGPPTAHRSAVLDQVAVAVALELVRSGGLAPARRQAGRELLRDIASDRFGSAAQLAARAAAVGLLPRRGHVLVAVCFGVDATNPLRVAVDAAADAGRRLLASPVVADVGDDVLVVGSVVSGDDAAVRALLVKLADAVDSQLRATTGGRVLGLAAGPTVHDVPGLVRSVRGAREASVLARRLGTGVRTLLAADVGVHRLLLRLIADPDLERFVDEQLGALLEHDARYGRELVRTLDTHLACGMSKTRTSQALGVRRQTLYDRLDRIEELIGCPDLAHRERRTALDLALLAWRLRSSAAR